MLLKVGSPGHQQQWSPQELTNTNSWAPLRTTESAMETVRLGPSSLFQGASRVMLRRANVG